MTTSPDIANLKMGHPDPVCLIYSRRFFRSSRALSLLVLLFGAAALLSWDLDIHPGSFLPHHVEMTADAASCFILFGLAMLLGPLTSPRRWKRRISGYCVAAALLIAILSMFEFDLRRTFSFPLFPGSAFSDRLASTPMVPTMAGAFLFYGIAIPLLVRGRRSSFAAQLFALAGLVVGFVSLLDYLLHAEIFLNSLSRISPCLETIIGIFLLGFSILAARPHRGFVAVLLKNNPAGIVARRLIAPSILGPVAIGWIAYNGWRADFYDTGFAFSIIILGSIILICGVTIRSVIELNRSEKERRRLVEAHLLSDARERGAREASQMKSDFVANISHELRTPMNGVLGMTSLLLSSNLTTDQREQAETIRQSGDALLTLVNEILDFSKIEAGKIEFEEKPFSLRNCIDEVIALFTSAARRSRIDLIARIGRDAPTSYIGDPSRIRQVLINLVGNALKFTESGMVSIEVEALPLQNQFYEIHFKIIDTGIGISLAAQETLFRPFHQVDGSASRRHGGTGLGLAICKRLVELMNGSIAATSVVGSGSTFEFILPMAMSPEEVAGEADSLPPGFKLVLVAGAGNYATLLKQQIEQWGIDVLQVADPLSLMQLPSRSATAALMDRADDAIHSASRMQMEAVWNNVPRILLDFDEPLSEEEKSLFTKHLLKPLKRSHLAAALRDLTGTSEQVKIQRVATQPIMAVTHPLRVLLAEDNHINQKVAVALLARLGYRVDVAANGLEAVESVMRQPYDLVLLDIQMPEMDGVEAAAAMKKKLKNKCPRLVALTANAFPGAREQYLAQNFDEYLSKPLVPDVLQRILSETKVIDPVPPPLN